MNYSVLNELFNSTFKLNETTKLISSDTEIHYCSFRSNDTVSSGIVPGLLSDNVEENSDFVYPVFMPAKPAPGNRVILLLHGLNERSWGKYLTWAEYLCTNTGKPVILFPIAFHMNRSPRSWSNPRLLQALFEKRKSTIGNDRTLSFSNLALSERITENPARFYSSGRQSLNDMSMLASDLVQGKHPLFQKSMKLDIFAYSIGAFLSQIALMSDQQGLYDDTKLFMFCGGSVFSEMDGESRSIMDKTAFEKMLYFYRNDFETNIKPNFEGDKAYEAFFSMLTPEHAEDERIAFFSKVRDRIRGISLKRDKVIPYQGVLTALGRENTSKQITLIDFPYEYTHENPFPVHDKKISDDVNRSFGQVFQSASAFLAS